MGDLKLAAAIGALLGPVLAVTAILIAAVAGGVMAIGLLTARGGGLAQLFSTFLIGLPFVRKAAANDSTAGEESVPAAATMPYGVAIGVGTMITTAVCLWTGQETWFLSFVGIAGSR
jgi:prepilin peptidase CpaA